MSQVSPAKVSEQSTLVLSHALMVVLPTLCRIVRAFLIEEQKIVVRALKAAQGRK